MIRNGLIEITTDLVLFFDMDGTLIDSSLANFNSYYTAINSVIKSDKKITFNPSQRLNRSNLKTVVPNLTENEYEQIIQEKEKCFKTFLNDTFLITKNAEILLRFSDTNKTVLVTNCREDRALATLDYHGIKNKFSTIFCRKFSVSDKKINKYENAISVLGVLPDEVVAFENEEEEIADAIKAGIKIINPVII